MSGEKKGYFRRGPDVTGDDIYSYHIHFPEPSICQRCQAILKKGNWSLDEALRAEVLKWENPKQVLCPACRRIMDDYPAGIITLKGAYLERHKEDILQTIHNEEQNAKQKNPLERIMKIEEDKDGITITTTDSKLARRIGRAVNRANGGELKVKFSRENNLVRIYWERD
jgi:NMD protein affecting ribosome stability and mRNA decay